MVLDFSTFLPNMSILDNSRKESGTVKAASRSLITMKDKRINLWLMMANGSTENPKVMVATLMKGTTNTSVGLSLDRRQEMQLL